jgi:hypothetical protein
MVPSSWRSWFWNSVLFVVLLAFAAILTGVIFEEGRLRGFGSPSAIGFALAALAFWIATARALFVGVWARPHGVVVRGPVRTVTIPWAEVKRISYEPMITGAAALGGATAPVLIRQRPGKPEERVELTVLGGYGINRRGLTPAVRATHDLNLHLARWRDALTEDG